MTIVAIETRILAMIPSHLYEYVEGTGIQYEGMQIVLPLSRLTIVTLPIEEIPEGATPETHQLIDGLVVPIEIEE